MQYLDSQLKFVDINQTYRLIYYFNKIIFKNNLFYTNV